MRETRSKESAPAQSRTFEYAIEVRNPRIIGPDYRAILKAHGAAHVYNHYTSLPPLLEQHAAMEETFTAPFTVVRLLTPRDTKYHDAVKASSSPCQTCGGKPSDLSGMPTREISEPMC
jgi:hypothetical protein